MIDILLNKSLPNSLSLGEKIFSSIVILMFEFDCEGWDVCDG